MRHLASSLVLTAISCAALAGGDDAKKLQGTWEVTELIAYGKKVDFTVIKGTKFTFAKNTLTVTPPNNKIEEFVKRTYTFKLNPAKKPAEIDLVLLDAKKKGIVSPGIYELNGNTLRWCQPDGTETKDRPKDFKSPEKSGIYLFTLKRV